MSQISEIQVDITQKNKQEIIQLITKDSIDIMFEKVIGKNP